MFRITKVEFKNICQYEALTVDVDVGLMAVCGRNGQGKTNFLRGLGYGLTGPSRWKLGKPARTAKGRYGGTWMGRGDNSRQRASNGG